MDKKRLISVLEDLSECMSREEHNPMESNGVDRAIALLSSIPDDDLWFPVGEIMPDEHEKRYYVFDPDTSAIIDVEKHIGSLLVLVTVRDYELDVDFTMTDRTIDKKWVNFEGDGRYEVIAWRPMPEPHEEPDLNDKVCNELSNWTQWKKEVYNQCFKSTHSTALK